MRTLACLLLLAGTVAVAVAAPKHWGHELNCRTGRCPMAWKPVCACTCDMAACRTFRNPCLLHNFNCHNAPDYYYIGPGACESRKRKTKWKKKKKMKMKNFHKNMYRNNMGSKGFKGFSFNDNFRSDFRRMNENLINDNFQSDFTRMNENFFPDFDTFFSDF